uniref:Ig-like domain-containing protein n=1 Tax=Seriola dumerili TaxID=41447 RepID=A0A3B4UIS8_SERDU
MHINDGKRKEVCLFSQLDSFLCLQRFAERNITFLYCWGVTYPQKHICAFKGSTVKISCSYSYPSRINGLYYSEETFWSCEYNSTQLSTSSDHNKPGGKYTGEPGVTLSVTDAPKLLSVSVSPSGEIVEGSSVTLTCSSYANPAANYTWYKENDRKLPSQQPQLFFRSIQPSESGEYYCAAENEMGRRTSARIFIDVKYAPKLLSVSVSPSGEIVEGSSVNLTCSSDANPAANYTWYKENEDSPKASGQIFTITDLRPEHSGNYYCEAQNTRGRRNSTLNLTVVAGEFTFTYSDTAAGHSTPSDVQLSSSYKIIEIISVSKIVCYEH